MFRFCDSKFSLMFFRLLFFQLKGNIEYYERRDCMEGNMVLHQLMSMWMKDIMGKITKKVLSIRKQSRGHQILSEGII